MISKLKKHGLSDTKHQLKFLTPKCSSMKDCGLSQSTSRIKTRQDHHINTISHFEAEKSRNISKQNQILNILINLVNKKQKESCTIKQHDRNPIKFICLEENCAKRIGCSYCFLENHQNHTKIQSKVCLNDLVELKDKIDLSRGTLKMEMQIKKELFLKKIDKEIATIKQEFINNLDYLNRKINQSIESSFHKKFVKYSNYTHKNDPQNGQQSIKQEQNQQNTFGHQDLFQFQSIIQKFRQTTNNLQLNSTIRIANKTQQISKKYQNPVHYNLSKEDEHFLLVKLSRLNLTYVQEYIKHQNMQMKEFVDNFKIYQEYYAELNSSLSEFFASFKRAIPKVKSFQINLVEPEIFNSFTTLKI